LTLFGQIPPIPCEHCGVPATYKVRETLQSPYLGMTQAFIRRIAAMSPDMPICQRDLNRWAAEIADENSAAVGAVAVNTTIYGREDETR